MNLLFVAAGALVGAPCRYLVDLGVRRYYSGIFPWGTLLVNVAGSLGLGLLLGAAAGGHASNTVVLLAGTGFCGAFTTFSTFVYESLRLDADGARMVAALNLAVTVLAGIGAAAAGWAIAQALW